MRSLLTVLALIALLAPAFRPAAPPPSAALVRGGAHLAHTPRGFCPKCGEKMQKICLGPSEPWTCDIRYAEVCPHCQPPCFPMRR